MLVKLKQGIFKIPDNMQNAFYANALEYIDGKFKIDEVKLKKFDKENNKNESICNGKNTDEETKDKNEDNCCKTEKEKS